MWFKELVGFDEISPEDVRKHLEMDGTVLRSKVNGESYECGTLEIPTVQELREKVVYINSSTSQIRVSECIANVQELHKDAENVNALFQAASQFNLLEMVGPEITPESGVGRYQFDYTQGPACAIACGAGTIYRNYFVPVGHKIGQTSGNQIDCLEEIADYLNNTTHNLWEIAEAIHSFIVDGMSPLGLNERFRFYRYDSGQRFKRHIDGRFKRNENEESRITFMIYLNDDYTGGETRFNDVLIQPQKGMALFFIHEQKHESIPITDGVKYVLRSDVMYNIQNDQN